MDSLTQITLGAAVGEIALGRRIGNRAMFWGAIAGTIPDLDVFTEYFVSPIQELAIHRGFSHSIVFSIIGAFVLGWGVDWIYKSKYHKYFGFTGWLFVPLAVVYFLMRIFDMSLSDPKDLVAVLAIFLALIFWLYRRYFRSSSTEIQATKKEWQWLFFWALLTHALLDCFTTYGTQIFQPFSSYRVAFASISVADPLYTFPFLLSIIAASFLSRTNKWRRTLTICGISISSIYMSWTLLNKYRVHNIWTNHLEEQEIQFSNTLTTPTILNNVLWYCIAETEDGFYHGLYSFFDSTPTVNHRFTPKNHNILNAKSDDPTVRTLSWFSGGGADTGAYSSGVLADPSQDYDMWAQAYRMLGGFIDCDHDKSEGSGDRNNGNGNGRNGNGACSRWMMWAAVSMTYHYCRCVFYHY